ncbi:tetraacyldisaccharide 4'-kinase [Maricaulis sp.]|uniref:tetraacyldisaccharide 4'-kinase n=1 Tax=Maricaulis sp. TaxID=1486257 RepID=UPI001B057A5A|nr:tetraacyldisaccharide 4'-kinase [Maricaulis sp.]MBO6766369.1 tetraacyldisaccharide 4'-kinase [Maricaulis sp.]
MREPAFWRTDGGRGSGALARALLSPLGHIYAWTVARRLRRTEPAKAGIPVFCVGNLTVGGTGKTPVAAALMARLKDMGRTPAALSRGYGGTLSGPVQVYTTQHSARETGDEPLLLAREAAAWISRDRVAGAQAIAASGADVIVMDDGHQNPALAKDCSIVVVDGIAGWGAGTLFPAGPLREPVAAGLARADAVIVMMPGPDHTPDYHRLGLADLEIPVFHAWLEPAAPPPDGPLVAFAGIGRPQKFFDALSAAGARIAEIADYPDHHPYSARDIAALKALAQAHDARLVTTEKDWVRLDSETRRNVIAWPVKAEFANPAALDGLLRDVLDAANTDR